MRSWVTACIWAFCICWILGGAGCYAGAVGVGLGVYKATRGGGSQNTSPSAEVSNVTRSTDGTALVEYFLKDDHGGSFVVAVEWQLADKEDNPWHVAHDATGDAADGSDGKHKLIVPGDNSSTRFVFVWNAKSDLSNRKLAPEAQGVTEAEVRVGITLFLCKGEGTKCRKKSASKLMMVGNNPPKVIDVTTKLNPDPEVLKGDILFSVFVQDTQKTDPVTLEGWYRVGMDGAKHRMQLRLESAVANDTADGQENHMVWESESEWKSTVQQGDQKVTIKEPSFAGKASDQVYVEFLARDDPQEVPEKAMEAKENPLLVDNNANPGVTLLDRSQGPVDKSFQVPIRLAVTDEERDPVTVILQWALKKDDFKEIRTLTSPIRQDGLKCLQDLVRGERCSFEKKDRKALQILSEAAVKLEGVIDDSSDLPATAVRETDFVREGLLFHPPTESGSVPLENPKRAILGKGFDVFLLGRELELLDASGNPLEPPGEPSGKLKIIGFDPRTSTVMLDRPRPEVLPPGTRYRLSLNADLTRLSSRTTGEGGSVHIFVWDALKDMQEAGVDFNSPIKIRALAVNSDEDAGVGEQPPGSNDIPNFPLQNDLLIEAEKRLKTDALPKFIAVGALDDKAGDDVVVLNRASETVTVYHGGSLDSLGESCEALQTGNDPLLLAMGDVTGDGRKDIIVVNAGSNTTNVYEQVDGCFPTVAQQVLSSEDLTPVSVAIGGFDGNGGNDVAVAHKSSTQVHLYFQNSGHLGIPAETHLRVPNCRLLTPVGSGKGVQALAFGDVNEDGLDDLLVMDTGIELTYIYLQKSPPWLGDCKQNSDLNLQPDKFIFTGTKPVFMSLADVTGDGRVDLLVASLGFTVTPTIGIYKQDSGNASLFRTVPIPLNFHREKLSTSSVFFAVGDVDSDSRQDIVATDPDFSEVHVFLQGDSGFPGHPNPSFSLNTTPGESPRSVAIGDLDGDGRNEVLVPSLIDSQVRIYRQKPSDEFTRKEESRDLTLGAKPSGAAVGDVDGDGLPDIVVVSQTQSGQGRLETIQLQPSNRLNNEKKGTAATPVKPSSVAIGDLNGDGQNDVLVSSQDAVDSGTLTVYSWSDSGLSEVPGAATTVTGSPSAVAVGDIDGDGRNDAVVLLQDPPSSGRAAVYLQGAEGTFASGHRTPEVQVQGSPYSVAVGDVNEDARADLVVGSDSGVSIFLQDKTDGLPLQATEALEQLEDGPFFVAIRGPSAEGGPAILVVHTSSPGKSKETPGVTIHDRDPVTGDWRLLQTLLTGSKPSRAAVADLNGDGRDDVVVANRNPGEVELFLESKQGKLPETPSQTLETDKSLVGEFEEWVETSDFNGDGRNDIMVVHSEAQTVRVYLAR